MDRVNILRKIKSWSDFKGQLSSLTKKQKGDAFEELTKYYLQLHPKYATQLENVWLLKEVPPRIRKKLNLPASDEGIDLIAETKDKDYWAVQCKFKSDETESLSRKDLSTFTDLAFNICNDIELGLVCTTGDRFSHKLTLYGEQLAFCAGDVWRDLDPEFFRRLHRHLDGQSAPIKPLTPRAHQRSAIKEANRHYVKDKNTRGKLIMPCGTGKSLTGYWIAKKLEAQKILIAVPSLALIRQTLEVWARESFAHKQNVHWIAVCSDETVGQINRDDVAVLTQDLGVRVHTDPKVITQWLKTHRDCPLVVFSTYQSGQVIAEASRKARMTYDLGIFDEAHKTVGKQDSLFNHLLHDINIKINKRVFMTATERRYRGQSNQIASMDDPDLYGRDFEVLSFKRALESIPPILSDYKIITIGVTRDEIAELIGQKAYVKPDKGAWNDDLEAEMLASVIALRKAMKKKRIRHAVSFHSSIAKARAFQASQDSFTAAFPSYGKLETFHVSGKTPTAVRSREIDEFAVSKRSLITNARCLTEGVDVPDIDCVLFADPKRSAVDIVQAVGRALRTAKGKKYGYVIVPVLLEDDRPDSTAFEPVLTILSALAANDERIIEYFQSVSEGQKSKGRVVDFSIELPDGFNINTDEFINAVELNIWSRIAKLSWRKFDEARNYVRSLNLSGSEEWAIYSAGKLLEVGERPFDIPSNPQQIYKDKGWVGMGDWLGTGNISSRDKEFFSFEDAKDFVRSLQLESGSEWRKYSKGQLPAIGMKPDEIPSTPGKTYKDRGWKGMGDWLGTGRVNNKDRLYMPFRSARAFVRKLNLKSQKEWMLYSRGGLPEKGIRPEEIPSAPSEVYKDKGWEGVGDWLGTGNIRNRDKNFRPFEEAKSFVHKLGIKSQTDWVKYSKGQLAGIKSRPSDIPSNPHLAYKNSGWVSMGDWLGSGSIATIFREYRPFKKARLFAQSLQLKSETEWRQYCRGDLADKGSKPDDIPTNPGQVYKDKGWAGMGDWLGTGNVRNRDKEFLSFEEARTYVRKLNLKTSNNWGPYCSGELHDVGVKPKDIPRCPQQAYKDKGWAGFGDWLGTGNRRGNFRPFKRAREFVRQLDLKSSTEWVLYCASKMQDKGVKPEDIPSNPQKFYKDKGWKGTGDWLGTGTVRTQDRKYRSFISARSFVRKLGLKSQKEWSQYNKGDLARMDSRPDDIPLAPQHVYKDKGWKGFRDWLGTKKPER